MNRIEKNILFLIPSDDNEYLNFYCRYLGDIAGSFIKLNFVGYAHKYGINALEKYVIHAIEENKIDLVMVSPFATDYQLSVEYFSGLSKKVMLIFVMFDDENYFDDYSRYYCQAASAVITTDYFAVAAYQKLNMPAALFFSSYSTETYKPLPVKKDIEVSFVGDFMKSDRKTYIEHLKKNGINVQVFGKGTENGFVEQTKIPEIFSRSKINLNFTKLDALSWINMENPLLQRVRQNKGRPLEIAFTSSFCLSENSPAMGAMLEVGKELDVFNNKEELLEKVRFYLSNDGTRERIASNAYSRATSYYKAETYIPKAINEAINASGNGSFRAPVLLSKRFKANAINGLAFSMLVMLRHFRFAAVLGSMPRLLAYGPMAFIQGIFGGMRRSFKRLGV